MCVIGNVGPDAKQIPQRKLESVVLRNHLMDLPKDAEEFVLSGAPRCQNVPPMGSLPDGEWQWKRVATVSK